MAATELLVRELMRPAAYPRPPEEVELRQTHISLLFFAGDRVYKVKKPVDLGFLDFTTLERRRFFCEEEVRLNRRLAERVYLGVVPVSRGGDGHLCIGGSGEPIEWAVEMVRLPEHRMLARMLERGEIDNALLNELVLRLARFHAAAPTGAGVDEHGSPAAVAASVEQNFEQLAPFERPDAASPSSESRSLSPDQLGLLRARARRFLATKRELFERRVSAARIREGHGDLHAENICFLPEGPLAYDCIEFDRALRCLDVASDVAFLAMDLDRRGFPAFARYLAHRYERETGDAELSELLVFYKNYRAVVRAKVALLTAADPAADAARREELRREGTGYLQLAVGYELEPTLVLLCGLPASGKSFLAPHLGRPLRAMVLHSDVRRKQLAGLEVSASARSEFGTGMYSPEKRADTYRSLLTDAAAGLTAGRSVIVDASFVSREFRAPFVDAATRLGFAWCLVHVTAPEEVVRARLASASDTRTASDADLDVYLRARESFEPPDELPRERVLEVRSGDAPPEEASAELLDRLIALARDDRGREP
jgi:aminoglycoside phosphotransferase family enzyme/predicted kinase